MHYCNWCRVGSLLKTTPVLFVLGCHARATRAVRDPISSSRAPVAVTVDAPGVPMARRLELINESIVPDEVKNENHRKAAQLRKLLDGERDPELQNFLRIKLAKELLNAGESEDAIKQLDLLLVYEKAHPGTISPADHRERLMGLAVAYMRLGEQENCLLHHTSESCLVPIQGGGVHTLQRGSRSAIKYLTEILKEDNNVFAAGWLLNVAYMTLGEYPAKVPKKWLIPPEKFKSDYDVGRFHEIAGTLGLDLRQLSGGTIVEDFDNDGYLDIMISSVGTRDQLRLFHNNGDGTFTERTKEAGLIGETGGLNIMQTDYNNDGYADVLILRGAWYGAGGHWPLSLLRNNCNGTFTDVTEQAGLLRFHPTQTAVWFDYNGDGYLDLFVGNESWEDINPCELFRNNGDGTFTECSKQCGLDFAGFVKGAVSADYNNDGRPDLYLSCQGADNHLFRNDGPAGADKSSKGPWKFTDVSAKAGIQAPKWSFPCFFFDYDNDGWPDLFVSGYSFLGVDVGLIAKDYLGIPNDAEYPRLYHNNHDGSFSDVTVKAHLHKLMWGMGINYGDLDNDGWLDFYVGTGNPELSFLTPNRMFRNAEGKFFQEVTTSGGFGHLQKGHGISFADLNNDGQQDIYESMGGIYDGDLAYACLYENPGHHANHWITLKLEGVQTNRAAIGARVKLTIKENGRERSIYRTVSTGGSFGANPLRQEIGLGKATKVDKIEIFWPVTGKTQALTGLALDRFYKVREGDSAAIPWPLKSFQFNHTPVQHHHMASARQDASPAFAQH